MDKLKFRNVSPDHAEQQRTDCDGWNPILREPLYPLISYESDGSEDDGPHVQICREPCDVWNAQQRECSRAVDDPLNLSEVFDVSLIEPKTGLSKELRRPADKKTGITRPGYCKRLRKRIEQCPKTRKG